MAYDETMRPSNRAMSVRKELKRKMVEEPGEHKSLYSSKAAAGPYNTPSTMRRLLNSGGQTAKLR